MWGARGFGPDDRLHRPITEVTRVAGDGGRLISNWWTQIAGVQVDLDHETVTMDDRVSEWRGAYVGPVVPIIAVATVERVGARRAPSPPSAGQVTRSEQSVGEAEGATALPSTAALATDHDLTGLTTTSPPHRGCMTEQSGEGAVEYCKTARAAGPLSSSCLPR
jgi:hypothetical protein